MPCPRLPTALARPVALRYSLKVLPRLIVMFGGLRREAGHRVAMPGHLPIAALPRPVSMLLPQLIC